MTGTVADAWSRAPIGELRLGERVFPVPPLTFGRFQRLLAAEPGKVVTALAGHAEAARKTRAERLMERALRWSILRARWATKTLWRIVNLFGLGKRRLPAVEAAEMAAICVPGVSEAAWRQHGTQRDVVDLFLAFGRAHDWAFIADAIRLGEPIEPGEVIPSKAQVVSGLLAVAKATGYTVEALHEMRVDGFYLLVDALRSDQNETVGGEIPLGVGYSDQTDGSKLLDLLKQAEEARRGE